MLNLLSAARNRNDHVYKEVETEENESVITDPEGTLPQPRRVDKLQRNFAIFNVLLFTISISILLLSLRDLSNQGALNYNLKQVNTFSPILEQFPIPIHHATVNGSVYNNDNLIWRQEPSPEVDAAWEGLARIKWFAISSSDVEKLGKDPEKTVKIPKDWGYGMNTHFAALDSQHLLHCLNMLRRSAWPEYYNIAPSPWHTTHLSHCTYLLMQALTCQPSLNVITHNWVEGQRFPFPDFDIERKCVDYESVWEWNMERGIRYELLEGIVRPEGARVGLDPERKGS